MGYFNESLNDGLDRLQRILLEMRHGEELACAEAARLSGLNQEVCRTVLEPAVQVDGRLGVRVLRVARTAHATQRHGLHTDLFSPQQHEPLLIDFR